MTFTSFIAIWGAATGTIGTIAGLVNLRLRFKAQKIDKAFLVCSAKFEFVHNSNSPNPDFKFILRNSGKRTAHVDCIKYYFLPKGFIDRIRKRRLWKLSKFVVCIPHPVAVKEGTKSEIINDFQNKEFLVDLTKVEVISQSGDKWKVDWPTRRKLKNLSVPTILCKNETSLNHRLCRVLAYRVSSKYYIYAEFCCTNDKSSPLKGRFFCYNRKRDYDAKVDHINSVLVDKFLVSEIDEIT